MNLTSAAVYGGRPPSARACAAGESVGSSASAERLTVPPQALRLEAASRATTTMGRDKLITPSISGVRLDSASGGARERAPMKREPSTVPPPMKTYCLPDLLVTHRAGRRSIEGFSSPPRAGHIEPTRDVTHSSLEAPMKKLVLVLVSVLACASPLPEAPGGDR